MNNLTDQQLLRDYAEHRSEAAFAELVRRHIDLVHSVAFRLASNAHAAQDVTQAVFLALAQNAAKLDHHPVLSGWLHTTTRNLAAKSVRAAVRRQKQEQEAAAMNELLSAPQDASWEDVAPHLDATLGELNDADRDAIVLRYFERKSASEIGCLLGVSDEAAQKRVSRALERLREFFAKRGIRVGASGLAVAISANAVQSAPVGLASAISAAALAGAAAGTSTIVTATKIVAMTTLQKTLVTATVAVLAGAGVYEARQAAQLRDQVQTLQQQQVLLTGQIQQLQNVYANATNQLADSLAENAQLKSNPHEMELLKLRGQITQLKVAGIEDSNDPTRIAARSWAERVALLKQRFADWSGKQTPEIELLAEQDWLDVAAKHQLESEDDCRNAMSDIRTASIEKFAGLVKTAVKQYSETNNGQLPSSTSQLIPFVNLQPDLAATILNGYEVAKTGTVHPPNPGPSDSEVTSWAILQKDGPADPEHDHTFVFYTGGWYFYGPSKTR